MPVLEVPFANLGRAVARSRPELDDAIARVLASAWFVLGAEGKAFEEEFAAFAGTPHAVGCANGTDAIELALRALGVGPGAEVVTQANTCVPTVAAIARTGATPVLCDVEPEGATMDPASLRDVLSPRTRAVVPVHLYGQCADVEAIAQAADGVPLVEDCAQAHGAALRGRGAGTMGTLAAFSFYPTKNLGALGDGGAVTTADEALARRVAMLRQYGQSDRYRHELAGINSRLDEIQAAILRVRLGRLAADNERRRRIAATYTEALAGTAARPLAELPGRTHVFHLYVVRVPDRERFRELLAQRGVGTLVHYPTPVHRHPPYATLADGRAPLTVAERLAGEIVSLPLYPELEDEEIAHVAGAVREAALALG